MKKYFTILLSLCFLSIAISAQNYKAPGDTLGMHIINFDDTSNIKYIHIDTSNQNLWQIGKPQKTIFSSAYSIPNAILTDTINDYPINNYSYFDLYAGFFNFPFFSMIMIIDFWHKYDSDTLKDGGYITVSWDKGLSWMNIIKDTVYMWETPEWNEFTFNLYSENDTLFNGEYGFSGSSNGWKKTGIAWFTQPVKLDFPPDTMIIRFNFISDSINDNKEGWMIDNIRLYGIELMGEINNVSINNNFVKIAPNPFNTNTDISFDKQYNNIKIDIYDIQGKLMETQNYIKTNRIKFNRNNLKNGLYFLKFTLDKNITKTAKIIISD